MKSCYLHLVLAVAGLMVAQNWSSLVDVLARITTKAGLRGLPRSHSGSFGSGGVPDGSCALARTPAHSMAKPLSATEARRSAAHEHHQWKYWSEASCSA
jgi:hypothetical protein